MKNLKLLFLLILSTTVHGQSFDSEVNEFIEQNKLILKRTKKYNTKYTKNVNSLISFYSDTISFQFNIRDISIVKTKDKRRKYRNINEINKIKTAYKSGVDSIMIDSMSSNLESMIWGDLLGSGRVNEINIRGKQIHSYSCKYYSRSPKGKIVYYALYDEFNNAFWGYSGIICWGIRFRE